MSTESKLTAFALQDILLGIAASLNDAQRSLNEQPPYDPFGRPNTMYHVPHLDFNLQVTSEFETVGTADETGAGGSGGSGGTGPYGEAVNYKQLKFTPANKADGTGSQNKTQIASSISGRFVATVPNEGLPQTVIQVKPAEPVVNGLNLDIELEVLIANAVGEVLPDSLVEFNYDEDTTLTLNSNTPLTNAPTFTISEMRTDSAGKCTAMVSVLEADYDNGLFAVIEVNVGTVVKSVALSNQ